MTAPDRPTVGARVFDHRRVWELTESVFLFGASVLAHAAMDRPGRVDAVIGIADGGVPLATEIAGKLGVERFQVRARHNTSDAPYQPATGQVMCDFTDLADQLDGRRLGGVVLVVDDICGSGATFRAVTSGLASYLQPAAVVVTAALCRNTGASQPPHVWLWDVSDWVVFPWEQRAAGVLTTPLPAPSTVRSR